MDLNQLEAFAAVMTLGSVTGAGRSLGRSQPAVSKAIGELEAELGYALFDRNGPRVTPTAKAFLLYEEVERSLVGLRSIRERAQEIAREEVHPVHLVATPALASTIAPAALQLLAADKERAFPNTSTCAALRPSRWCMRSCIAPSAWG
jgi:DNA-binding transcriptional LysR family regulator